VSDSPENSENLRAVLPLVAIIGRPNVGKSTIFNRLIGRRRAIVSDEPGITRDRIYGTLDWSGVSFEIVDTGGIIPGAESEIPQKIFEQARVAIEAASLVLFVVDARAGRTTGDEEMAGLLRRTDRPVFLLANKIDTTRQEAEIGEFARLAIEKMFPVSAEHGRGFTEVLDDIAAALPETPEYQTDADEIKVAIIGRPNAGKSTLLNMLVGEERSMVSPVAGTTRDAVDSVIERAGVRFRFIDTAGIRRKGRTDETAEKLSVIMARKHLGLSDLAILLVDGERSIASIDATIGGYAHEAGRSVLIVVNKWDLVEKSPTITADFERKIRERLKFLEYAPIHFVSAKTGQRVDKLYGILEEIYEHRQRRVGTGELNQFLKEVSMERGGLPSEVKVRYIAQVRTGPPTFVVFSNTMRKLHFSFERFLINQIRRRFSFEGSPIIIKHRARKRGSGGRR
jgi:GTP-binding protein